MLVELEVLVEVLVEEVEVVELDVVLVVELVLV